ncbi:MAG: VTT domain-containing protein [Pseudomonadota bacterium]
MTTECCTGSRETVSDTIINGCTSCGLCTRECAFLQKYGTPDGIARQSITDPDTWQAISFECSLCGLCTAVCPKGLDIPGLFFNLRTEAARQGTGPFPEHRGILAYERKGNSKRYSFYSLPDNCDTIFFPGCTLPGTRPSSTVKTIEYLREHIPDIGIVLDCCAKPSHDLGRKDYFEAMFREMEAYLLENGIRNVIVACPSCYRIFATYGTRFNVRTVYEIMASKGIEPGLVHSYTVTIHDPCPVRFETGVHKSVRNLVRASGLKIADTRHSGVRTVCCGEGGAVSCMAPELASSWTDKRVGEAGDTKIASYCAGCVNFLSKKTQSFHILDLVFDPENTINGRAKVSRAPLTYVNRLRLKRAIKREPAAVKRERNFNPEKENRRGMLIKLAVLLLIVAGITGFKLTGADQYIDQERLRTLVQAFGNLGPMIYMLIYTIAPVLFVPGLPLTIAGGVLFGPFWGVVYSITAATLGAGLAFLISRYVSRDFVESRLAGPKWMKLQDNVENHGWKVVVFTRLIPLFPFNLLNYAFGLTRIRFSHYMAATFFSMLPACIAFIVFSSSLLDLLKGRISAQFMVGLALILLVSVLPLVYRKIKGRSESQNPM